VIARLYPQLADHPQPFLALCEAVMDAQAAMVLDWLRTGFIHGVMNTDNMSVSGETFDYGPCAFMNRYRPETVFSSIDRHGRYAFNNQGAVLGWNQARLAESFIQLVDADPDQAVVKLQVVLELSRGRFAAAYAAMLQAKLGIPGHADGGPLVGRFLDWMERTGADYTNSFLALENPGSSADPVYQSEEFLALVKGLEAAGMDREIMQTANPRIIPRNHLVEEALAAYTATGSLETCERLLYAVQEPGFAGSGFLRYREPSDAGYDEGYKTYCNT
jgi:uncharacterized protein YdiU (UPF0061 family)